MTAQVAPRAARWVGRPLPRKEDARLITGQTRWTDNLAPPGLVHMAVLRSPAAHARIGRVEVSAAMEWPGVVAAFSGADLASEYGPLPTAWPVSEDTIVPDHLPLAVDEVRHVGDGVAVVLAEDRYQAADALEAVQVEYDPLPAVVDLEAALTEGGPLVHADAGTNRCFTWSFSSGDYQGTKARADVVLSRRFVHQRLLPTAMEPRAVVADITPATGDFTLWTSSQVPHFVRIFQAQTCRIPEHKLRVIAPDVGGGFGGKLNVYAEEALALAVARRLGRPVKWTASRGEDYQATTHGRGMIQDVELTAARDGRVLGLKVDLLSDMGAYLQIITAGVPLLGRYMYPGIYEFEAHDFSCQGVFTNKTPTDDSYRGAGRPEPAFAIERLMDELAAELGLDPLEVRERNWIRHEEFPYTTVAGLTYDSGNYEAATARARELFGYDALRREQAERRRRRYRFQLGIGVSTYTEMAGLAPSRWMGEHRYVAGGWETASVRLLPTGRVEAVVGTSPHGQGHGTSFSQIVADVVGVSVDDVDVLYSDTEVAPWGLDTYGSRSMVVGGAAVLAAAEQVVEKARFIAAHLLEAAPADVKYADGRFSVRGAPGSAKSVQEVAYAAFAAHDLPAGAEPVLLAEATVDPDAFSYPHGTHLCAAEVDTETGRVTVRSYVAVDDVGTVVNPLIVDGQIHGGVTQGLAQALYEEAVFDAGGNLVTGSMVDYLVPGAPAVPPYVTDRTETPATTNPMGVKGAGEAGTIASTPAVVNAVVDALRPFGVTDVPPRAVRPGGHDRRRWKAHRPVRRVPRRPDARAGTSRGDPGVGPTARPDSVDRATRGRGDECCPGSTPPDLGRDRPCRRGRAAGGQAARSGDRRLGAAARRLATHPPSSSRGRDRAGVGPAHSDRRATAGRPSRWGLTMAAGQVRPLRPGARPPSSAAPETARHASVRICSAVREPTSGDTWISLS
jgi:carbon-monoxide dehydrogenase large subunit